MSPTADQFRFHRVVLLIAPSRDWKGNPMHTYVKSGAGWQAGFAIKGPTSEHTVSPLGPVFEKEEEAASLASYMNGGRWSPGELAGVFPEPEEDPDVLAEEARAERRAAEKGKQRPEGMDYPPGTDDRRQPTPGEIERPQPHGDTAPKAKQQPAHPAKRKADVKHAHPKRKR